MNRGTGGTSKRSLFLRYASTRWFSVSNRPFGASPGLGRGLLLRIPPRGRAGRCHGLARGAPQSEILTLTIAYRLLSVALLNHLIRPREQFVWKRNPDLFRRLKAYDEFKLHRLLHW